MRALTVLSIAIGLLPLALAAEDPEASDAQYITQVLSAAPPAVARGATVVRVGADGSMRTLRKGDNGFTCLMMMCNDANGMEFIHALMKHEPPPNKVGVSYMLAGDMGVSNTDPYATSKTPDNHWIVTGPHIMILGPPSKTLGYSRAKDPDPNRPYMMWVGTPYEHAMIPVAAPK